MISRRLRAVALRKGSSEGGSGRTLVRSANIAILSLRSSIAETSEDSEVSESVPKPETSHHRRKRMPQRVQCDDERRAEALRSLAASYSYECKEVAAKTARRVRVGIYYLRFMCEQCHHILSEVC